MTYLFYIVINIYLFVYVLPCKNIDFRFWKTLYYGLALMIYGIIIGLKAGWDII